MKRLLLVSLALALTASGCPRSLERIEGVTAERSKLPQPARFRGRIGPIGPARRARMTSSWQPGCPVPLEDLRLLTLRHWGFDGRVRRGELVVHEDEARPVVRAFRELFRARFRIERMELVDAYDGDDERSMAANNTSAFNCRGVPGSTAWSEHAYGRAIDINPIQNPEVRNGEVSPATGRAFVDRPRAARGMVLAGGPVVGAFAAIGWGWGGDWRSLRDYQHFSANGR
jgi:hypothetical protein